MKKGTLLAIGAYTAWGILPIYWKLLQAVPALEILSHRMVWSLLFMAGLLAFRRDWRWLWLALRRRQTMLLFGAAALLLAVNWFTYIWAVNAGFIVEASLGYFINPLVNVFLGMLFFGERLRRWQWVAIGLALAGVLYLTLNYGQLPWIGLTLAFTFGLYGLLKKQAPLGARRGMFLEMGILFLPAFGFLLWRELAGSAALGHAGALTTTLLVMTGAATAIPLLFFAAAAPRISLQRLGVLQYIAPTLQFLIGVFLYQEPFTLARLLGFALIWLGLAVYFFDGVVTHRRHLLVPAD